MARMLACHLPPRSRKRCAAHAMHHKCYPSPVTLTRRKVASIADAAAAKRTALRFIKQRDFSEFVTKTFRRIEIYRDGHCLFTCFATLFNKHGMTYTLKANDKGKGKRFTVKCLRNFCADELLRTGGKIAGLL